MEIGTNMLHAFHPYFLGHNDSNSALYIDINLSKI